MIKTSYLQAGLQDPTQLLKESWQTASMRDFAYRMAMFEQNVYDLDQLGDDYREWGMLPSRATSAPARIVDLRQTCGAFPSQWEGQLADGRELYIRYRGGVLRLHFSTPEEPDAVAAPPVWVVAVGHPNDGLMEEDEMLARLAAFITLEGEAIDA
jgi:hypothetical protein